MFLLTRRVGTYDYTEARENYRKNGQPTPRVIARWPAERTLADELDLCEIEIIICRLWLDTHEMLTQVVTAPLSKIQDGRLRRRLREVRYGAAGYRRRLARAQRRLPGLRKAARATGVTVRSGKLPARVMLGTDELDHYQKEEMEAAKAAIELEMQRRQHREAYRASLRRQLRESRTRTADTRLWKARKRLAQVIASRHSLIDN